MDSLGDSMSEYDNESSSRVREMREAGERSGRLKKMKLTPSEAVKQAWQLKKLPLDKLVELGESHAFMGKNACSTSCHPLSP